MFCRYCGQEILDEAVICPHCGVMVKKMDFSALQGQAQTPQSMQQSVDNVMDLKKTKMVRIFAVITAVLIALSLMLLFIGIVEMFNDWRHPSDGGHLSPFVPPLAFGFVSLGTSIPTFIMGLKQQNAGVRLISIILFIASIFSFVTPFVCNMQ